MESKNLFQQLVKSLKDKHTQRMILGSLLAAVCFLMIIKILPGLNISKPNEEVNGTQEETSSVAQEEKDDVVEKEIYFTEGKLVTINGKNNGNLVNVQIEYKENEYFLMTCFTNPKSEHKYETVLQEDVICKISLENQGGIIRITQDGNTLLAYALVPESKIEWSDELQEFIIDSKPSDSTEESGETESTSETVSEAESSDETTSEESSSEVNTTEASSSEESSSEENKVNDEIGTRRSVKEILSSAILIATLVTIMLMLVAIMVYKKANPFSVIIATLTSKGNHSRK